ENAGEHSDTKLKFLSFDSGVSMEIILAQFINLPPSLSNLDTILVEKKKNVDRPVRCAEFVPANIASLFDFKIAGINSQTYFMDTYLGGLNRFEVIAKTKSPGFILDRDIFVKDLVSRFERDGGRFINCARIISIETPESNDKNFNFVSECSPAFSNKVISTIFDKRKDAGLKIKSKIVVGADGPCSFIGKFIGSTNKSFVTAIQERIKIKERGIFETANNRNKIFFTPYLYCGYGWIFPKNGSMNIGVGLEIYDQFIKYLDNNYINTCTNLKNILTFFKEQLCRSSLISRNDLNSAYREVITGLIPVSGIVGIPALRNFILVGDAAGLCNPITGAGIFNAVYSSKLALEVILKAVRNNNLNIVLDIKDIYRTEFGHSIGRALAKRNYQRQNWLNALENDLKLQSNRYNSLQFFNLIKQTWVTFKDYWR
ncbi:MAG: NAD(P)/FAD-dependent oxidoreductase, partial [Actinobacteria bacterium]|nr:NAD(P)/FAD-dependent oxidoreductase [Actinomycetota bacterium]